MRGYVEDCEAAGLDPSDEASVDVWRERKLADAPKHHEVPPTHDEVVEEFMDQLVLWDILGWE